MARKQLDILALEPFYGGVRKAVMEAVTRCSRHRWTVLKLPPRKIERRLLVAATWFGEQLSRSGVGRFDVLLTSEAINLADLFRLVPELAKRPSVVYFHDNQLPDPANGRPDTPVDLVNLNSAMAATEVWFNSVYNLKTFLARASQMVARHGELASRNPMPGLTARSQLMPPPIEQRHAPADAHTGGAVGPPSSSDRSRALLIDARDADPAALIAAVSRLHRRNEEMSICTIGGVKGWPRDIPCQVLRERDEIAHLDAVLRCGIYISLRQGASGDDLAIRALAAGCYPVFPALGVYPELVPEEMHKHCLHDGTSDSISDRVLDAWYLDRPPGLDIHASEILEQFDPIKACKAIDHRLSVVVQAAAQSALPAAAPPP